MMSEREAATMFIVAFKQCKSMLDFAYMIGVDPTHDERGKIWERYAFLNGSDDRAWWGRKKGRSPLVRTHVARMWPKLFAYLDHHSGDPGKLLAVADQVTRLKWKNGLVDQVSKDDRNAAARTRRAMKKNQEFVRERKTLNESHARRAWNVCK